MSELRLASDFSLDTIVLSNIYIDEYMPANNESQVKIYLYLLRNLSAGLPISVSSIADTFNYSARDVERALHFMENQGLMSLDERDGSILGLRLLPPEKKHVKTAETVMIKDTPERTVKKQVKAEKTMDNDNKPEINQLLFVAEQYVGKTLSPSDITSIMNIYEKLGLNEDVVEYLIEYCVSLKKKSFSYIENVAADWAECGVKSVSDAKALTGSCPKEVYDVFRAFGIKGGSRKPSYSEVWFVNKWTEGYGFSIDVIKKACEITVDKTHCASFEYADAILTDWNKRGIRTLEDVEQLKLSRRASKTDNKLKEAPKPVKKLSKSNSFYFENQRDYDYDELERMLINK